MFGAHRTGRFIFVDQPPFFLERPYAVDPAWQGAPASVAFDELCQTVATWRGPMVRR
jgi:hypothetical protein